MGKVKAFAKKALPYVGGAIGVGAVGYGVSKLLRGRKGTIKAHRGGVGRLKTQVQRLSLRIKKKQLQRKLFKEEMRL